jgi:hypothetical protein
MTSQPAPGYPVQAADGQGAVGHPRCMGETSATSSTARWALTCVLVLAVVPLNACRATTSCTGMNYDYAQDAVGSANEHAALDVFLHGPDAQSFPADGWAGPSPAGVFTSGSATVTVIQLPGSATWVVSEARTC